MNCSPYNDAWAMLEYLAVAFFFTDMALKFMLAYQDRDEGLVTDHRKIVAHYLK